MTVTATITSKGQLTLPRDVRRVLNTRMVVIEKESGTALNEYYGMIILPRRGLGDFAVGGGGC